MASQHSAVARVSMSILQSAIPIQTLRLILAIHSEPADTYQSTCDDTARLDLRSPQKTNMSVHDQHNPIPLREGAGNFPQPPSVIPARMLTALIALVAITVASGSILPADCTDYRSVRSAEQVLLSLRTAASLASGSKQHACSRPGPRAVRIAIHRLTSVTDFLAVAADGSALSRHLLATTQRLLETHSRCMPPAAVHATALADADCLCRAVLTGRQTSTRERGPGGLRKCLARFINLPPPSPA